MSDMDAVTPHTIVLIHGLWMTPHSWAPWVERFSGRGHEVLAPAWPGLEGRTPAEIRRDPSALAGLGVREIVDHYDGAIRALGRKPIVIGHSFGGLITQLLVDRDRAAAAVPIAPAPPRGVFKLPWSSIRTAWPALRNPANRKRSFTLSPEQFRYRFGNTMSEQESNTVYEREYIPGTGRVLFQAAYANLTPESSAATRLDQGKADRAPMLFIAGEKDHVSPPSAVRANVRKYRDSPAITEYREYPGRSHFLCGETGWEEIADLALGWATEKAGSAGTSGVG